MRGWYQREFLTWTPLHKAGNSKFSELTSPTLRSLLLCEFIPANEPPEMGPEIAPEMPPVFGPDMPPETGHEFIYYDLP